jgi:hypothetical protein
MRTRQTSTNQERIVGRRPKQTRTYAKRCKYCHTYRLCRRLVVLQGGQLFPAWVCRRCKQRIWGEKERR